VAESLRWVAQILDAAEKYQDEGLLISGHLAAVSSYYFLGEPIRVCEHANKFLKLYSEEKHGRLAMIMVNDAKTLCLLWKSYATLLLGYPD
jgi:hypothetical protein